jgi:hypothetical protein
MAAQLGVGTSDSSGEGGLGVRSGTFGCTSVATVLAGVSVLGSGRGSSHLHRGENTPQRIFIRLMALPRRPDELGNASSPAGFQKAALFGRDTLVDRVKCPRDGTFRYDLNA